MDEWAMRAYRRWTRRGGSADRPRRRRVVLDDAPVTVLSADMLARMCAEDTATLRAVGPGE